MRVYNKDTYLKIKRTLEEWDKIYYPIWYRFAIGNVIVRTSDEILARSMGKSVEVLGRIEKLEFLINK